MNKWMVVGIACLGLLLVLPESVQAGWLERMTQKLSLSQAQQQSIRKIMYASQRQKIRLRANLQLARLDLKMLTDQHRPELNKVSQAIDKLGKLEIAFKKERILMMLRVKAQLSAQQAKVLTEWHRTRKMRRMKRRRRWWKRQKRMRRRQMRKMRDFQDPTQPAPKKQ